MKSNLRQLAFLILLTFLINSDLNAQFNWTDVSTDDFTQPFPFGLGLHVVDEDVVWYVPFWLNGTISPQFAVTTDGATTWDVKPITLNASNLVPIIPFAIDADTAWMTTQQMPAGIFGSVMATHDSGDNWFELPIPYVGNEVPIAVHFYNGMEGIVVSQDFYTTTDHVQIYRTINGGSSWTNVSPDGLLPGEVKWLYNGANVMERIGNHLWMGTGKGRVIHSTDRGQSWNISDTGLGDQRGINCVAFENETTGIALSTYHLDSLNNSFRNGISVAAQTTDGGLTWQPINVPVLIEHITHVPGSEGVYIGGSGYTGWWQHYISRDGGNNWQEYGSPGFTNTLFASPSVGYATTFGYDSGIAKYDGAPLTYNDSPLPEPTWIGQANGLLPYANFVSNYINDLSIVDQNVVWGVTASNNQGSSIPYLVKTEDGGDNWESIPMTGNNGRRGFDIHAINNQVAFATNNNASYNSPRLIKTEDGGDSWETINTSNASGGYVHFFSELEGLIINDNTIEITIDGGVTWDAPATVPALMSGDITNQIRWSDLRDEAIDDTYWYVSYSNNVLLRTTDKGQNWELIETPAPFKSIAMRDDQNGLAVSYDFSSSSVFPDSSTVYSTNDGGATWEVLTTLNDGFSIFNIEYVENSQNSYVGTSVSVTNTTFTNDGGVTWEVVEQTPTAGVARFLDHETGWMARTYNYEGYQPVIYKWGGEAFPELMVNTREINTLASDVSVFPNPFNNHFSIQFEGMAIAEKTIDILDVKGKVIRRLNDKNAEPLLQIQQLSDLPSGTYLVKMTFDNSVVTKKISKF